MQPAAGLNQPGIVQIARWIITDCPLDSSGDVGGGQAIVVPHFIEQVQNRSIGRPAERGGIPSKGTFDQDPLLRAKAGARASPEAKLRCCRAVYTSVTINVSGEFSRGCMLLRLNPASRNI